MKHDERKGDSRGDHTDSVSLATISAYHKLIISLTYRPTQARRNISTKIKIPHKYLSTTESESIVPFDMIFGIFDTRREIFDARREIFDERESEIY